MKERDRPGGLERAAHVAVAVVVVALVALFLWSGQVAEFTWMNHDAANALYIGERVLHGDRLYVDWYYFVMPPIVFLGSATCFVAERLDLSPPFAYHLLVVATAGLGISVLGAAFPDARARRSGPYAIGVLSILALLVRPGPVWPFFQDFGQREHLFVLLFVPYAVWRLSSAPLARRVLVAAAAIGYAMMNKPHFVVLVAIVELFALPLGRSAGRDAARDAWRETGKVWLAITAGAALPFALLALHSWESVTALFTQAVTYHLGDSYDTYSGRFGTFLRTDVNLFSVALGATVLALLAAARWRGRLDTRRALCAGALVVAAYALFLQQQKFFRYHAIPFTALALFATAMLVWTLAETVREPIVRRGLKVAVLAALAFQIASGLVGLRDLARSETRREVTEAIPFLPELEQAKLVAVFDTLVDGHLFSLALRRDVEIMRPWTSNYTVGSLLRTPDEVERERRVRAYFAPIAERIRDERPDLVAFSPETESLPDGTLHDVFVERYGLFPTDDYPSRRRFPDGWVLYRRKAP